MTLEMDHNNLSKAFNFLDLNFLINNLFYPTTSYVHKRFVLQVSNGLNFKLKNNK